MIYDNLLLNLYHNIIVNINVSFINNNIELLSQQLSFLFIGILIPSQIRSFLTKMYKLFNLYMNLNNYLHHHYFQYLNFLLSLSFLMLSHQNYLLNYLLYFHYLLLKHLINLEKYYYPM